MERTRMKAAVIKEPGVIVVEEVATQGNPASGALKVIVKP